MYISLIPCVWHWNSENGIRTYVHMHLFFREQHSLSIQKCEKLERRNTELEEEMSSAKEEYLKARGML